MIDPQSLLSALESLAQETVGEAPAPMAPGAPPPDTIGQNSQQSANLLDAAVAAQSESPTAAAPGTVSAATLAAFGAQGASVTSFATALGALATSTAQTQNPGANNVETTVAALLSEAKAPELLANAQTAKALALLVSGQAQMPGEGPGAAPLARLVSLLRTAASAPPGSPAGVQARSAVAAFVAGDATGAQAAAQLARGVADAQTGLLTTPAYGMTPADAKANLKKVAASRAPETQAAEERDAVVPIPERDFRGNPYDQAGRARLARLGRDPRRGFAPESTAALEAEREADMELARSSDPAFDFVDENGGAWVVATPREAFGLESFLRGFATGGNVIVSFRALPAHEASPASAVVARLADVPGLGRLIVVERDAG